MKVLLTGATGLLGVHVAGELLRQGYAVKAVYRSFPRQMNKLPWFSDIEWVKAAITERSDLETALTDCQAVIHAAARTDPYPTDLAAYYDVNVGSTEHLLEIVRRREGVRLVYVSTASVFRPGSLASPATEESPYAFDLMASGYIASKYEAQLRILEAVQQGVDAVVVNPTFMLGPYDFKPSSGAVIRYVMQNRAVFYPGGGGKSFVDVRDAARATVNALRLGRVGECYLLASENLSYDHFFPLLAHVSGQKKHLFPMPVPLLRMAGDLGSFGERIFRRGLPLNRINATLLTQENYYSGKKAQNELEMPTSPVRRAMEDAMQWFGQ
ncbi:NAD-dependent epimerase/dehydratase family protein [Larkinella insperata]|uniref:NAD-dependent epimerase/dehydratase family protein n=1 Tax=Larkinella insperata TaxID=332158 RepID=A0ABW3Q3K0_9BACT|nr:NAD-dependent epimerase/dehydratase family protein [Larkinella insperata]